MKRFTSTEKWDKEWFMDLSLKHKVLWQFLCDSCDCAGVWESNWRLASMQIGEKVKGDDLKVFGDRVMLLPSGKVLITGFVSFQYGKLGDLSRPHQNILRVIEKHGIGHLIPGHPAYIEKPNAENPEGSPKAIYSLKEKDKDKEEEQDKEQDSVPRARTNAEVAEAIYDAYPKKVAKPDAIPKILKALAAPPLGMDAATWPDELLAITARYAALRSGEEKQFTPNPATWFNQRRFEDDPATWNYNGNDSRRTHRQAPIVTRNTAPLPDDRPDLNATTWRPTENLQDSERPNP